MSLQPTPPAPFGATAASADAALQLENTIRQHTDETHYDRIASVEEKTDSSDTAGAESEDAVERNSRQKITELARRFSLISQKSFVGEATNTFLNPTADPELNPHSDRFNSRKWTKNLLHITSRDPDRYPRRTAGVSFRNLSAFGYGTAADYQTDVANMWLKGFGWLRSALGFGNKVRIDILRNFEGFVRSGEMLVVLGRPGR